MKIAYLDLLWWGTSIGGEHYYATLRLKDKGYTSIKLEQKLSKEMADYLNNKEGSPDFALYNEGELTERFNSPKEAVKAALKECKKIKYDIGILFRSCGCSGSVSEVLWAKDKNVAMRINKLYKEADKLNFYSGKNDQRMEEIDNEFNNIIRGIK